LGKFQNYSKKKV